MGHLLEDEDHVGKGLKLQSAQDWRALGLRGRDRHGCIMDWCQVTGECGQTINTPASWKGKSYLD